MLILVFQVVVIMYVIMSLDNIPVNKDVTKRLALKISTIPIRLMNDIIIVHNVDMNITKTTVLKVSVGGGLGE